MQTLKKIVGEDHPGVASGRLIFSLRPLRLGVKCFLSHNHKQRSQPELLQQYTENFNAQPNRFPAPVV
jgi:hypothetical protein